MAPTPATTLLAGLVLLLVKPAASAELPQIRFDSAPSSSEQVVEVKTAATTGIPLQPVVRLNPYTFSGNALESGTSPRVGHWIVIFCPSWWEPCQNMEEPFSGQAAKWQDDLNSDRLLSLPVRFAKVDCATDKPLCNEQDVDAYPTIHHYAGGEIVHTWRGGRQDDAKRFDAWLNKLLSPVKQNDKAPAAAPAAKATRPASLQQLLSHYLAPGDRAADVLLMLIALAGSARLVLLSCAPEERSKVPGAMHQVHAAAQAAAASADGLAGLLPEDFRRHAPSLNL